LIPVLLRFPPLAAFQGLTAVAWTAIGTISLAFITLLTVVTTVVITAQDRRKAAQDLIEERAFAEKQLAIQLKHSEEQLTRQLKDSEEQRFAERKADSEQQQEAAAWQVAVMLAKFPVLPPGRARPPVVTATPRCGSSPRSTATVIAQSARCACSVFLTMASLLVCPRSNTCRGSRSTP
jgi:hypothetical protein